MEHVGNKWKIENNPSLLGMKFDAILLHTYIIAIICFPFIPITLSSMRLNIQELWAISNHPIHLSII